MNRASRISRIKCKRAGIEHLGTLSVAEADGGSGTGRWIGMHGGQIRQYAGLVVVPVPLNPK